MTLQNPFPLLLIPAAAAAIIYSRRILFAGVRFSSGDLVAGFENSLKARLSRNLILLRAAAVILLIIALARPVSPIADSYAESEGIDIVLALDTSTSMLAEDFKTGGKRRSRIEIVRTIVRDFIQGRKHDRIGIISFAGRAYMVSPPTLDYAWLMENLERVKSGMQEDGTAIGSGILTALQRLKDSRAKSKVVILLTDGRNNAGKITPLTAAEAAKALNIKIYTIGAGSKGPVPYPVRDPFGNVFYQPVQVDLDEDILAKIAAATGARYFRAVDTESLRKIFGEINSLEKTPIRERGYQEFNELFPYFLIPGLALILLEIVAENTFLRRIP